MARVMWTRQAVDDLKAIHDFIARDTGTYAEILVEAILEAAGALADEPEAGTPVADIDGLRQLAHGVYRIVYRLAGDDAQVLTVCPANCD